MRIPSNKIADIVQFFRAELKNDYEKEEIETFIGYCFEEYAGIERVNIFLNPNATVSESELLKFNFAIKNLKQHRPIQYILGKADFYDLKFIVNPHVLIPRPETEELVDLIIKENQVSSIRYQVPGSKNQVSGIRNQDISHLTSQISILDIGTGSGCIPITLKKNIPSADLFATDISKEALEVAKQNALQNKVSVEFFLHDILSSNTLPTLNLKFDIIVSNPPYICVSEKKSMQKNVLDHEPPLALFVPDDAPLLFYEAIANFALKHLKPMGKLYLEINEAFGNETSLLLQNMEFKNIIFKKDINTKNRILHCTI